MIYIEDSRITKDRSAPSWFLKEIKNHDPLLSVKWWNLPPKGQDHPCFQLIRAVGNFVEHIFWFDLSPGEEENVLRKIRAMDSHKWNDLDPTSRKQVTRAIMRQAQVDLDRKNRLEDDRRGRTAEELASELARMKENNYFSYLGKRGA